MPRKSRVPAIPEKPAGRNQPERPRANPKARLKEEPPASVVQLDLLDPLVNPAKPNFTRFL